MGSYMTGFLESGLRSDSLTVVYQKHEPVGNPWAYPEQSETGDSG